MNALARKHGFDAASPILADHSCWLFDGPGVDPFVTSSRSEAEKHAEDLNSDRQRYGVIEFNSVEGWVRDRTEEFWRAPAEDLGAIEPTRAARIAANRMAGMYR